MAEGRELSGKHDGLRTRRMRTRVTKDAAHLFRFRKKPSFYVSRYLEGANNNTVTVRTSTANAKGQRGRFDRGILKLRRRVG
jgi:hypothetical protein